MEYLTRIFGKNYLPKESQRRKEGGKRIEKGKNIKALRKAAFRER
jgi:hypothetical protein